MKTGLRVIPVGDCPITLRRGLAEGARKAMFPGVVHSELDGCPRRDKDDRRFFPGVRIKTPLFSSAYVARIVTLHLGCGDLRVRAGVN